MREARGSSGLPKGVIKVRKRFQEKPVREQHKRGEVAKTKKTGARGFVQQPSTYRISKAPTGRGRCRRCCKLIPRGATRLEVCAFVRPGRYAMLLRCTERVCVDARLSAAVLAVYKDASRVPTDPSLDGCSEALRVQNLLTSPVAHKH